MHRSCNDINILQRSPLFAKLANGETTMVQFVANGQSYDKGYYLADDIYLKWAIFVTAIVSPRSKEEKDFHYA
jgi:hypothetical protein